MKLYYELIYLPYVWNHSMFLWKTLCCAHILNCNSHDLYISFLFFTLWKILAFLAKLILYTISFHPQYIFRNAIWSLMIFTAWKFSGVGWAPTQGCMSLDIPQLVVFAWGYLLTCQLNTKRCSKNYPPPSLSPKHFKKLGLKEIFCEH